jgi:hypothetical protein
MELMAVVRCLGCGEAFEAMGSTAACPICGTVMRVTGTPETPPPGMSAGSRRPVGQPVQVMMESPVSPGPSRGGSQEPWLSGTAKMWVGIVLGVIAFALVIDWFRMKITPTKKVVDEAKVEQLAHELADERVNQLAQKLEKAQAAAKQPPSAAVAVAPAPVPSPTPTPVPVVGRATGATAVAPAPSGAAGPASRPVRNAAYAGLANLVPVKPADAPNLGVTDQQIEASIKKGIDWFLTQFATTRLKNVESYSPDIFPGANAISLYALLTAGAAVGDERLRGATPLVAKLLDGMKEMPIQGGKDTYSRSLRISALTVLNRKEDRQAIEADARWLLESSIQGAFTYSKPPAGQQRANGGWDNSNSQYGGLGLWAAADAGVRVPTQFWKEMEAHWVENQVKISGGWAYQSSTGPATVAMTCAGATMLMLARDQMLAEGSAYANVTAPLSKPLERALEWLDEGDHTVNFGGHYGYTLYGLERVGLASGYKYFGKHDWYRELSKKTVDTQQPDGSWLGGDSASVETAFHLLFLSRGREPVFMGKLRWGGNWSNRPRDVATLTKFGGRALERALNWQVLGLQRDWTDWTDAPVMLITSEDGPQFTDADVAKLRSYALAGGVVFTHAENGSAAFNTFAADLAKRMFPEYAMGTLPPTHPIYSALYPLRDAPGLAGVGNGSRLLMVHSPTDLTKQWGTRAPLTERERQRTKVNTAAAELGVNVVVYATGKRDLRRRTDPAFVPPRPGEPLGAIPVARLRYEGNWDPEPWGWVRAARKFDRETGIALDVRPVDVVALEPGTAPVAHLTGTAAREFSDAEVKVVREYVEGGGVLLVDACGGSAAFAESVRAGLLARAFPNGKASPVGPTHPVMGRERAWMGEIERLLTYGESKQVNGLRAMNVGNGAVLFTDLDISTGLLGATVVGVSGYEPTVAERLVRNAVVWAVWPNGTPVPQGDPKQPK